MEFSIGTGEVNNLYVIDSITAWANGTRKNN